MHIYVYTPITSFDRERICKARRATQTGSPERKADKQPDGQPDSAAMASLFKLSSGRDGTAMEKMRWKRTNSSNGLRAINVDQARRGTPKTKTGIRLPATAIICHQTSVVQNHQRATRFIMPVLYSQCIIN